MRISYLADQPALAEQLIPELLEHWKTVRPEDTAESRNAKFRAHLNRDTLPIAWVAHDGGKVLGTAALRATDLEGREDLSPWLGGVFVRPQFRNRGIASSLCRVVELKAHRLRAKTIHLFALDHASLYSRLGWQTLERWQWRGHAGEIMVKYLT